MVVFIWSIWKSLTLSHQIIAVTSGCMIIIAILFFIYGQTRKTLYVITHLLYKMHFISHKHASSINFINDLNEEDFYNAYRVIDIEFPTIASIGTLNEIRDMMSTFYSQYKDKTISDEDTEKFCNYLMKKTGLLQKLTTDEEYKTVINKIKKMMLSIPSEEIILAVNKFTKTSNNANSLFPLLNAIQESDDDFRKIIPPKLEAALIGINNQIDEEITTSLVKVRESIEKYYRGGIK